MDDEKNERKLTAREIMDLDYGGKTRDQEAKDSTIMLGVVLAVSVVVILTVLALLILFGVVHVGFTKSL